MKQIAIVGAGKIGEMIVELLNSTQDYSLTLIDGSAEQLERFKLGSKLQTRQMDVSDVPELTEVLKGHYAVLSATPFYLTEAIASAAKAAKVHYLDLTEDVASTERVKKLAEDAETAFIPQCGLAPGFISIVANHIAEGFDELQSIRMRVGALPQYPSNSLNYNLTWSTDGVINEYIEPCVAISNGELSQVPAMEQLEHFSLDGIRYEAFNTSGGLGTLAETLAGKVNNLSYQTIRYPGHCQIMKTLLNDLQLADRRDVLKDVLENAVPATMQDVVLIFVTVSGKKDGELLQESYANKVYAQEINGKLHSAIQLTTAGSICAVLDLLANDELPQRGFVKQESISLPQFLNNRFGAYYDLQAISRAA